MLQSGQNIETSTMFIFAAVSGQTACPNLRKAVAVINKPPMRILSLLLLLALSLSSSAQTQNPFLSLKFDRVVIYDYEIAKQGDQLIVDSRGQLSKSIKKQVRLNKTTVENLNLKLGDKKSYGNLTADCFEPHLGIVYYLRNKIVAHVSVCLDCNSLRSNIYIPGDGMSKSFRQFLNSLLKKYNFSHQIKAGVMFDK